MQDLQSIRNKLQEFYEIADREASITMSKLRSKAEKKVRDIDKRLQNVKSDGELFKEEITPDSNVMDKYSHKIYEQVMHTIDSIKPPKRITLRSLNNYTETIRQLLIEQDKVLIKYVKLLKDKKYKSRVKSLDRSLRALNKDLTKFEEFISRNYAPHAEVERSSVLIEEILENIEEYEKIYTELQSHKEEVLAKNEEIKKVEQELKGLIEHPARIRFKEAVSDYETTQRELDYAFSNIRKVLKKYEKYASKNRMKIDSKLLSSLVTDVAHTLAEVSSLMSITAMFKAVRDALDDPGMNLNKDKRETARADINKFLDGELEKFHSRAREIYKRKLEAEEELKGLELENRISQLENTLAALKRDRLRIYQRNVRQLEKITRDVEKLYGETKTLLQNMVTEAIDFEITLPPFPEWVELQE